MKLFLQTLFFFLLVTQICFAQWVQLGLEDKAIKDIAARNFNIFAITSDSGSDSGTVYRSTDNGVTWSLIVDSVRLVAKDIAISPTGSLFMTMGLSYTECFDSLSKSSDNGNTWTWINVPFGFGPQINVTVSPIGFVFCGSISCTGGENTTTDGSSLTFSTDDGLTWTSPGIFGGKLFDFKGSYVVTSGIQDMNIFSLWHFYLSSDYGQTWSSMGNDSIVGFSSFLGMGLNGNIIIGGDFFDLNPPHSSYKGLVLSSDSCYTWTQVSSLIPEAGLSIEPGGVLVGTDTLGVFLFSDNGDSLGSFNEGLTSLNTHTLSMDNNGYVYLGTDNGVWRRPLSEIVPVELTSFTATTNGKEVILNWSTATELNNQLFEVQRSFEGSDFATVGFVNGKGTTTERQDYSYTDEVFTNGKYSYRLKQIDYLGSYEYSDVVEIDFRTFNSYLLEQCYPNPFNPTTTIGFGIQNKSNVKITVLNSIGEEVAVVLNEEREPGYHQVEFNAMNLPSGVYFYQLKAGSFIETKKMLLIK